MSNNSIAKVGHVVLILAAGSELPFDTINVTDDFGVRDWVLKQIKDNAICYNLYISSKLKQRYNFIKDTQISKLYAVKKPSILTMCDKFIKEYSTHILNTILNHVVENYRYDPGKFSFWPEKYKMEFTHDINITQKNVGNCIISFDIVVSFSVTIDTSSTDRNSMDRPIVHKMNIINLALNSSARLGKQPIDIVIDKSIYARGRWIDSFSIFNPTIEMTPIVIVIENIMVSNFTKFYLINRSRHGTYRPLNHTCRHSEVFESYTTTLS